MAEEHRCEAPAEAPRLCANNCGFFGSPATQGLCSKCYRDLRLKEEQSASAKKALSNSLSAAAAVSEPAPPPRVLEVAVALPEPAPAAQAATAPGRCVACRKKVGLTGFRCRCGEVFCGSHRYPEQHRCSFDFKAAGRQAIAKANPVVKAEKLDKI